MHEIAQHMLPTAASLLVQYVQPKLGKCFLFEDLAKVV